MEVTSLNHFALFRFTETYWRWPKEERSALRRDWLSHLREVAERVEVYQVFPVRADADFLVWSALRASEPQAAARFFEGFARATNAWRAVLEPRLTLWGFTKPSIYAKGRSPQEIDPFASQRKPYLIVYPFVKTAEWYLMSKEARQGMMNEHIRIGRQYPSILQLLLYSFGLQDQEFVVVYETEDLAQFSDLVNELRSSEARRFTLRDTPIYTALWHPAEETLALWE